MSLVRDTAARETATCSRDHVAAKIYDGVLQQRCHQVDPDLLLLRLGHDCELRNASSINIYKRYAIRMFSIYHLSRSVVKFFAGTARWQDDTTTPTTVPGIWSKSNPSHLLS